MSGNEVENVIAINYIKCSKICLPESQVVEIFLKSPWYRDDSTFSVGIGFPSRL